MIVGALQVIGTVFAVGIGWKAMQISKEVQRDAGEARASRNLEDRLRWMHELRNHLEGLSSLLMGREREHEKSRRWMRTCLALSEAFGRARELPLTTEVVSMDHDTAMHTNEWYDLVEEALKELDAAIEGEVERARTVHTPVQTSAVEIAE